MGVSTYGSVEIDKEWAQSRPRRRACRLWAALRQMLGMWSDKTRRTPPELIAALVGLIGLPRYDRLPSSIDDHVQSEKVPREDWIAWGEYARPIINGVEVRNIGEPLSHLRRLAVLKITVTGSDSISPNFSDTHRNRIVSLLRSPDGTEHPDIWVPGMRHGSVPPRPKRWRIPSPREPQPFPWECQLNPLLEHAVIGVPPLYWDMGKNPFGIQHGASTDDPPLSLPLTAAERAQPATWPFLTHMYINAVADDPLHAFPWPIMVENLGGITCQDVFEYIHDNLQMFISRAEFESWPMTKRLQVKYACQDRMAARRNSEGEYEQGLRRIDFFGDRVAFRGLGPSPNKDGWVMFVGPMW